MGFTGFYRVLLGFDWVLRGFTGFSWVVLGFTGCYWVSLGFNGFFYGLGRVFILFMRCRTRSFGGTFGSWRAVGTFSFSSFFLWCSFFFLFSFFFWFFCFRGVRSTVTTWFSFSFFLDTPFFIFYWNQILQRLWTCIQIPRYDWSSLLSFLFYSTSPFQPWPCISFEWCSRFSFYFMLEFSFVVFFSLVLWVSWDFTGFLPSFFFWNNLGGSGLKRLKWSCYIGIAWRFPFYRVLPSFTGFLLDCTRYDSFCTEVYRVLLGFKFAHPRSRVSNEVFPSFRLVIDFYWGLPSFFKNNFNWFHWDKPSSIRVFVCFTGFYWVLLRFWCVWLYFTSFYLVLSSF